MQFSYHPDVRAALDERRPVVALESTVISHGLPFPHNLEVTRKMMAEIKSRGVVPAVIALIKGCVKIGLDEREIAFLADPAEKHAICKVSRSDISAILSQGGSGATTVSGTMILAERAAIRVFATGGIGGVHRGAEHTFDISADLKELGRTPVVVVASGCKSILDIPKTIEVLETEGVTVLGYKTRTFPTFYTHESTFPLLHSCSDLESLLQAIQTHFDLNLGGLLIGNPIPESASLGAEIVDTLVEQALREAEELKIQGKEVTPFLLRRMSELSGGKTLEANKALLIHNAGVAADIALGLAEA